MIWIVHFKKFKESRHRLQKSKRKKKRKWIHKIAEELVKVKKAIKEKEKEIDRTNEKINEMIEIVIEDEHKLNQEQQEIEKEKNDKKVELLMNKLAA